jgi:RNA polymerase sigma-70 factor (ECF subfamily)
MQADDELGRLSEIATRWTLLREAHNESRSDRADLWDVLVTRYLGAAYRYLRAIVGDPALAEDLTQEFALNFLKGRFHKADPRRGRFRDYLKTSLFHLVRDHYRRQAKTTAGELSHDPVDPRETAAETERVFLQSWRNELLAKTWTRLAEEEQRTGQPYHTVLRLRVDQPDAASQDLAGLLAESADRPMSADNFRQLVHRAREKFANGLLQAVSETLDNPTKDELMEELADLDLWAYCRKFVD